MKSSIACLIALVVSSSSVHAFDTRTLPHPIGVVDRELWDDAAEIGSYWMRVPVEWKWTERQNDVYTWGSTDNWRDQMASRSINMTPVITIGKCWANWQPGDPWNPTDSPENIPDFPSRRPNDLLSIYNPAFGYSQTYYDLIHTFVSRYGATVDRITVENEVNAPNFWESSIEDYVKVLTTARQAATDADPNVLVFDSGMGSGSWGVAIAEDRYTSAAWTWQTARDFMQGYYDRDLFVRQQAPQIWTITSEQDVQNLFASSVVVDNNHRVTFVLDNLWSDDLGMMLVDALNLKFTGDPWYMEELTTWIQERVAAAIPLLRGAQPLPLVNNEASNWCVDINDYNSGDNSCTLVPADQPLLASEMLKKVVRGIDVGIVQSVWFPLSNGNIPRTPRLGLYDYSGVRMESADAFGLMSRFMGFNRDYDEPASGRNGDVNDFVFTERSTGRRDVHVLWWDDGSHGSGSATVDIPVPAGATVAVKQYSQRGDSTMVVTRESSGNFVSVFVTEEPTFVYFDDGVTPIDYDLEPLPAPAPASIAMGAPAPNPASGPVRVRFGVPHAIDHVAVDVFDVAGRHLARLFEGRVTRGSYRVAWDGRSDAGLLAPNGTYLIRLRGGGERLIRKVVVAR